MLICAYAPDHPRLRLDAYASMLVQEQCNEACAFDFSHRGGVDDSTWRWELSVTAHRKAGVCLGLLDLIIGAF